MSYLSECCLATESALDFLNSIKDGITEYLVQQVFIWGDIPGRDNDKLLDFLRRQFNLDWLVNPQIVSLDAGSKIKIYRGSKSVIISLNETKNKAIMKINRQDAYEFDVSRLGEVLYRDKMTKKEYEMIVFSNTMNSFITRLVLALVLESNIQSDVKALSEDSKFVSILKRCKSEFDTKYKRFYPT